MELDGFRSANVAILDDNEQVVKDDKGLTNSGVFTINAKSADGVINASISGLAPSTQNISGSNEIVGVSGAGTGAVTCTLGVNDLPTDVEYKLIGASKADSGAWYLDKDTRSPYAALELVSEGRNGDAAHIGILKGQFYVQPQSLRTNNGTGSVNRATDSLQFKAINRHRDTGEVIQFGFEKDSGFRLDKFHQDVFPGADFTDDDKSNDHKAPANNPANNPVHNK